MIVNVSTSESVAGSGLVHEPNKTNIQAVRETRMKRDGMAASRSMNGPRAHDGKKKEVGATEFVRMVIVIPAFRSRMVISGSVLGRTLIVSGGGVQSLILLGLLEGKQYSDCSKFT